eukprot:m.113721 g.113721  ORF g.113721 m.113721 type:complete len:177 (+) comp17097_c0_seq1:1293-1823(+)
MFLLRTSIRTHRSEQVCCTPHARTRLTRWWHGGYTRWHTDGAHLFDAETLAETAHAAGAPTDPPPSPSSAYVHLPPHALTVFVGLDDVDQAQGWPEFFRGSHQQSVARELEAGAAVDPPVSFPVTKQSAIVFDYRIVHRGTANTHATKDRPLLYLVYAKPWFCDQANFGSISVFET